MRGLFGKYVTLMAGLVCLALVTSTGLGLYVFSRQNHNQLLALQQEKAAAAATRIELYIRSIEHEMGWTDLPRAKERADLPARKLEYLKLLRQVPAITDLAWIDSRGKERLRISRLSMDLEETGHDHAAHPAFRQAMAHVPYFGPVRFRNGTQPNITIARRSNDPDEGLILAEVNLEFVRDVISQIKVGRTGLAYVVDRDGRLVAHPDISLVLRKISMLTLPQVAAAGYSEGRFVRNLEGEEVLSASAPIAALGWQVFVELPREEAMQPLMGLVWRGLLLLVVGVALAVAASIALAGRMVRPIRALQQGARHIGAGRLDQRIEVKTGDELETLAAQFNTMSGQLRESYATLEQKVQHRTQALSAKNTELSEALESLAQTQRQLLALVAESNTNRQRAESANLAKSRFLAVASHDLRQPMHALNLYLGALSLQDLPPAAARLVREVRRCAQTMDDLFEGLLDISKLDANAVAPHFEAFAIGPLLERIGLEFEPQAHDAGLRLRTVPCRLWVRSDPALVERIVRNLVSNAVRYTPNGKVLVGCRRHARHLRVTVCDTGTGIAPDQQALVFEEFYQVGLPGRDRSRGLGLGLSIVQRLARLLDARIELTSTPGRGSRFSLELPLIADGATDRRTAPQQIAALPLLDGRLVVVIDDEAAVLDATRLLLEQWGCEVVAAASGAEAIERLTASLRTPDLLLCDYRLRGDETGLHVVETLRDEFNREIPALIVTGDVVPERAELGRTTGIAVLHKPVPDLALNDTMASLLGLQSGAPPLVDRPKPSLCAARTA